AVGQAEAGWKRRRPRAGTGVRDDRHRDREVTVVGDADVDRPAGQAGLLADPDVRAPVRAGEDLDVDHPRPRDPAGQRLADRFLRRPASGPAFRAAAAVLDLSLREELPQEAGLVTGECLLDSFDRRDVDAHPRDHVVLSLETYRAQVRLADGPGAAWPQNSDAASCLARACSPRALARHR